VSEGRPPAALAATLADLAASLEGVTVRRAGEGPGVPGAPGSSEVVVGEEVVAVLGPGALEARLRPAVAAAALRTPDVEASPRGAGWIRFAPAELDDFARDRAIAWLESAVRLGVGGDPGD
jgi:hypothetical protein